MPWNFTASASTAVQVGSGIQLLDDSIAPFVTAALDEAKNMYSDVPVQGANYYKVRQTDKNNITSQDMLGIGLMQVNSDADNLPVDKQQPGFQTTITAYTLRNAMAITREVLEDDRWGVIGDRSRNLMHSAKRTYEYLLADSFNRGFGGTGVSLLCEDGMGLFDTDRPQPRASAGTWANEDTSGALTQARITAARTYFQTYIDGNGDLDPQMLEKILVPAALEPTIKELTKSDLKPGTSLNDVNVVVGTPYELYPWLASDTVVYMGDGDNGLEFHVRSNPSIEAWNDGTNVDKMWMRVRCRVGTGCKRPGKFYGATSIA